MRKLEEAKKGARILERGMEPPRPVQHGDGRVTIPPDVRPVQIDQDGRVWGQSPVGSDQDPLERW
jgi:hypothetical protein